MSYLVNLDMRDRPVLVVGGGPVAARKIAALIEARARVTVIAPTLSGPVRDYERDGRVEVVKRAYRPGDARGACLVIAATDDDDVNRQVAYDAHGHGALVNVVDRPALCSFTLPAVVRRGDLTIAVATEGECPSLARVLRERLEGQYGPEYAVVVSRLGDLRRELLREGWTHAEVRGAVERALASGLAEALAAADEQKAVDLLTAARTSTRMPV